ncbi:MAG: hypothetical protein ACRC28_04520, partial [Clostridium sp.]|uniref:hypothetical protein n=1 Tax=Clostridium sp. TaxID=1506 RepID=UPI003F38F944
GTPPAFVLSQDQTLNKKFNLKLLIKLTNKRIAGLSLFIYYSVQFSKILVAALGDFLIISFEEFFVNIFFKMFFEEVLRVCPVSQGRLL